MEPERIELSTKERERVKAMHVWRPRRSAFGELVMMDSSPYRWLEERGPACHLVALIDDATSRVWGRLVEHDSTEENLRTLGGWLVRHGRPLALYTDKNSLFHTSRPVQWQEQLRGDPARKRLRRIARGSRGNRAAAGRIPLAAFSRPLPAATALPGGAAICNSFRPTACRTCRSKTQTPNQDQNQTHPLSRSPLEETLEADISTWQKTGHFYFALTQTDTNRHIGFRQEPAQGSDGISPWYCFCTRENGGGRGPSRSHTPAARAVGEFLCHRRLVGRSTNGTAVRGDRPDRGSGSVERHG